ncbi:MAG: hypothetical protein WD794_01870 [Mycobacteriales bacterium]
MLASVDPPAAQWAMNRTWHLPFRWVSDSDGTRLAIPLEIWNPDERSGLFHPLVTLVAPDGRRLVEHRSRDFVDRADDQDVFDALRELELPARAEAAPWDPGLVPEPTPNAFRTDAFGAYFRGIRSASRALTGRMRDEQDAGELRRTGRMAESFLESWQERRDAHAPP